MFQWKSDEDQIYDSSNGSQTLIGHDNEFGKKPGASFTMDAPEETLILKSSEDMAVEWPKFHNSYKTTTINILSGDLKIQNPKGVLWVGGNNETLSTEIIISSNFIVNCLEIHFHIAIDSVEPATNISISGEGYCAMNANVIDFSAVAKFHNNSNFAINCEYGQLLAPRVMLYNKSRFKIVAHKKLDCDSPQQYENTNFVLNDQSHLELRAPKLNSSDGFAIVVKNTSRSSIYIDEYSGNNKFIIGEGSPTIEIDSDSMTTNPFAFNDNNEFPAGIFDFITNDGSNNGRLILKNISGIGFQESWMISNNLIAIDGDTSSSLIGRVIRFEQVDNDIHISLNARYAYTKIL